MGSQDPDWYIIRDLCKVCFVFVLYDDLLDFYFYPLGFFLIICYLKGRLVEISQEES